MPALYPETEFVQKWNSLEGAQNIVQIVPGTGTQQQAWELLFLKKNTAMTKCFYQNTKLLGNPLQNKNDKTHKSNN